MVKVLTVIPDKCTGCQRCMLACSLRHFKTMNPLFSAIHVVRVDHEPIDAPIYCIQCGLCINVCPVNALSRDAKTGAVVVDREKCTGCGNCVAVCPIGAITLDPKEKKAVKCDLCGGDPACIKVCPEGALKFIEAPEAAFYKRFFAARLQRKELVPLIPYPRRR
mgnify:CR=1 FL=1